MKKCMVLVSMLLIAASLRVYSEEIKFSGYLQTEIGYDWSKPSDETTNFKIHRARLKALKSVTGKTDVILMADFADTLHKDSTLEDKGNLLLEALAESRLCSCLTARMGQFKVPFGVEGYESSAGLLFVNKGYVTDAIFSDYDIGLEFNGNLKAGENEKFAYWALGIFNGNGRNASDNNKNKDVVARLKVMPLKSLEAGVSLQYANKDSVQRKYGIDLRYSCKPFLVLAEFMGQNLDESYGFYATGAYSVNDTIDVLARYDYLNVASDCTSRVTLGCTLNFSKFTRLQANYEIKGEQSAEMNDLFVTQLQVKF